MFCLGTFPQVNNTARGKVAAVTMATATPTQKHTNTYAEILTQAMLAPKACIYVSLHMDKHLFTINNKFL